MDYINQKPEKFTNQEWKDVTIRSSLEFLPVIGSALGSAYFETKNIKRFKRLESFYSNVSVRMRELENRLNFREINDKNKDEIVSMIEMLNDEIEKETSEIKRKFYENFFIRYMDDLYNQPKYRPALYFSFLKELSGYDLQYLADKPFARGDYLSGSHRATVLRLYNMGLMDQKTDMRNKSEYREETLLSGTEFRVSFGLGYDFIEYCLTDFS